MARHLEMPISPRSRGKSIWLCFLTAFVVFFVILAAFDLLREEALIAPILWLSLVGYGIWECIKYEGGFRKCAINIMGVLAGTEFIEIAHSDNQPTEIWFGFQLFGWRHVQRNVSLEKVQTVEWRPGQATAMRGRDMKDWSVALWIMNDGATETRSWKPGQHVHVFGPARRREDAEIIGLAFVNLLRSAGVPLVRGHEETCFVREAVASGRDHYPAAPDR